MDAVSVSEITEYLAQRFELDDNLRDVWVKGEISELRTTSRGYTYLTLKDAGAQLKCVAFRQLFSLRSLTVGQMVQVHGRMSIYKPGGYYSLTIDNVQLVNKIGSLFEQLQLLKEQLQEEGLFDPQRRRPLPDFPLRIGVVTSADTAAFQDVLNVLTRRFPIAQVILSHTSVQGADAPPQIVRALERIARYGDVDVILLCRGGGSVEDLWCFNDERVVRAVAASSVPVITGVGHETDTTLVDYAADMRAPTPSAAAELLTPDISQLRADIGILRTTAQNSVRVQMSDRRNRLAAVEKQLSYFAIERTIDTQRQRIDELMERMNTTIARQITRRREWVLTTIRLLDATDPRTLLKRGYALVTRTHDGSLVTRASDTTTDTHLTLRLQDGTLGVRVEDIAKDSA